MPVPAGSLDLYREQGRSAFCRKNILNRGLRSFVHQLARY